MRIFDLHCDTIGECFKQGKSLKKNDLHIDLERLSKYKSYTQVFAIWIPDEYRGEQAFSYFNDVADFFAGEINKNQDIISLYSDNKKTPVKAILAAEGGSACGGTIEGLYRLKEKGVSLITLTWNAQNEIASGAFSEGGFTRFGKEFVKECEKLNIAIDVSHLNRESFWQLVRFYDGPLLASHSNADIVDNPYGKKRNLTAEQIGEIHKRNGIVGLNFCRDFIESDNIEGIASLKRQIEYFAENGWEDVVSVGADYDGCEVHSDLNGVEKLTSVYDNLLISGFSNSLLDKMFYENANRFFDYNYR